LLDNRQPEFSRGGGGGYAQISDCGTPKESDVRSQTNREEEKAKEDAEKKLVHELELKSFPPKKCPAGDVGCRRSRILGKGGSASLVGGSTNTADRKVGELWEKAPRVRGEDGVLMGGKVKPTDVHSDKKKGGITRGDFEIHSKKTSTERTSRGNRRRKAEGVGVG